MLDTINVAILDDHLPIIKGYEATLSPEPEFNIVGTAHYGEDLMPMLAKHHVDLLLLDVSLPMSPSNRADYPVLIFIPKIIEAYPHLRILISSMHSLPTLMQEMIDAGVSGYVLKDDLKAMQELGNIIKAIVNNGEIYVSEPVQSQVNERQGKKDNASLLTRRQLQAISVCAAYANCSIEEMSKQLEITSSTLRNLLSGAYVRLGVCNRSAAVEKARQLGLITPLITPPTVETLEREPTAHL